MGQKKRYGKLLKDTKAECGCLLPRYKEVRFDTTRGGTHAATSWVVPIVCPECRQPTRLFRTFVRPA